jgi:hypothetical protein
MDFVNCYEDISRAGAYATLEFANTYYLAYRDLPVIIANHVTGTNVLDFGCGKYFGSRKGAATAAPAARPALPTRR